MISEILRCILIVIGIAASIHIVRHMYLLYILSLQMNEKINSIKIQMDIMNSNDEMRNRIRVKKFTIISDEDNPYDH